MILMAIIMMRDCEDAGLSSGLQTFDYYSIVTDPRSLEGPILLHPCLP